MLNKNTNHVLLSTVTVQFHIAHLYEIQVSLFSFLFSTLIPKTQVFLSFAVKIDLTLKTYNSPSEIRKSPAFLLLVILNQVQTKFRREQGVCVGGWG